MTVSGDHAAALIRGLYRRDFSGWDMSRDGGILRFVLHMTPDLDFTASVDPRVYWGADVWVEIRGDAFDCRLRIRSIHDIRGDVYSYGRGSSFSMLTGHDSLERILGEILAEEPGEPISIDGRYVPVWHSGLPLEPCDTMMVNHGDPDPLALSDISALAHRNDFTRIPGRGAGGGFQSLGAIRNEMNGDPAIDLSEGFRIYFEKVYGRETSADLLMHVHYGPKRSQIRFDLRGRLVPLDGAVAVVSEEGEFVLRTPSGEGWSRITSGYLADVQARDRSGFARDRADRLSWLLDPVRFGDAIYRTSTERWEA